MLLGYAINAKGYRVYDVKSSEIKITRSVQLDEREVNSMYDTPRPEKELVTHVFKEMVEEATNFPAERRPVVDEPMNSVEESA